MPTPRKPNKLKLISGSREPTFAELDLPPVSDVPRPPSWMKNPEARREWRRLVPLLSGAGILSEPSLAPLGILCGLYGEITKAWRHGLPPKAAMVAQYRAAAGEFALTPATRSRASAIAGKSTEPNRFDKFKRPS
jgi:hypothetical protein